jgi:hypothetical protein
MKPRIWLACRAALGILAIAGLSAIATAQTPQASADEVPVQITGGRDTHPIDRGRPVVLVAAALGVPEQVFRDAFSHVRPAHNGGPTREEAQRNKHELLSRLEKYGVTNERLDEVSNFYRYRPQNGELWRHKEAIVFATLKNGKVTGFRVAEAGYGYSTPPVLTVPGTDGPVATAVIHFDKELSKNGSIESIKIGPTTKPG